MDDALNRRVSEDGLLHVRVTPNASLKRIVAGDEGAVRVFVTAPPEKGKANRAVKALVAHALGVPKSAVELVRGETSRDKVLRVRR